MLAAIVPAGLDRAEQCIGLERTRAMLAMSGRANRGAPMQSATAEPRSFHFSSSDLPPSERGNAVRELHERGIVRLEPLPDCSLHAQITKWVLPGAGILAGALSGLRQVATRHTGGDSDDVFLGINLAGTSTATQRGREVAVRDGEAILLTHAAGDFAISRPTPAHLLGLRVPRTALAPLVTNLDDAVMRLIPSATAPLRLLTRYVAAVGASARLALPELHRLVVAHIHDLIALSLGATRDAAAVAQGCGVRAARLPATKTDIAANLGDCDLKLAAIAAPAGDAALYPQALCGRGNDIFRTRARPAAGTCTSLAERSASCQTRGQLDRIRGRVRRFVIFQPFVSPMLWCNAVGGKEQRRRLMGD